MSNKLVRDNIPDIIEASGKKPIVHIADDKEYKERLNIKLLEEVSEFLEDSSKEEYADVMEVLKAIREYYLWSEEDLEAERVRNAKERGGFKKKIILDRIES